MGRHRPSGICAACGHPGGLHYGPEGVCVADCRSLHPLIQCGCAEFVTKGDPENATGVVVGASGNLAWPVVPRAAEPAAGEVADLFSLLEEADKTVAYFRKPLTMHLHREAAMIEELAAAIRRLQSEKDRLTTNMQIRKECDDPWIVSPDGVSWKSRAEQAEAELRRLHQETQG